ncbi:MAG: hypothetical protein LEGION0398_MBIBDBAK_01457 [Legionellaceae bacterium]
MDNCTTKYQMWLTDAHARVQQIEEEEESKKEALREQGREQVVKKMIIKGKSNDEIMELVDGFTADQLESLRKNINKRERQPDGDVYRPPLSRPYFRQR